MNVDIENQENFEKRKKIIIISLSAIVVLITLIVGFFFVKRNNKSSYENNNIGEVVNENNENGNDNVNKNDNNNGNNNENERAIVNENDYFFNKRSGLVTENTLLLIITGILFFFWENDKLSGKNVFSGDSVSYSPSYGSICGVDGKVGNGIIEKENWFGLATLVSLIIISLLVEFILNHLLVGSIAHLLSKDKNKRYFHTLKMSWKKRIQSFSSFSKIKTSYIILTYLICGLIIAFIARIAGSRCDICSCCGATTGEIIGDHGSTCCCGYGKFKAKSESSGEVPATK